MLTERSVLLFFPSKVTSYHSVRISFSRLFIKAPKMQITFWCFALFYSIPFFFPYFSAQESIFSFQCLNLTFYSEHIIFRKFVSARELRPHSRWWRCHLLQAGWLLVGNWSQECVTVDKSLPTPGLNFLICYLTQQGGEEGANLFQGPQAEQISIEGRGQVGTGAKEKSSCPTFREQPRLTFSRKSNAVPDFFFPGTL